MTSKTNKTKLSKTIVIKELKKAAKLLSGFYKDSGESEYWLFSRLQTLIASDYLMDRQFCYLQKSWANSDALWMDFMDMYNHNNIRDHMFNNERSKNTTKTNIFGLFVNDDGLPISDATCSGYFKQWEKIYYPNYFSNFEMHIEFASDYFHFDSTETNNSAKKKIKNFIKVFKNKYKLEGSKHYTDIKRNLLIS